MVERQRCRGQLGGFGEDVGEAGAPSSRFTDKSTASATLRLSAQRVSRAVGRIASSTHMLAAKVCLAAVAILAAHLS
jgi:hypothetical protein